MWIRRLTIKSNSLANSESIKVFPLLLCQIHPTLFIQYGKPNSQYTNNYTQQQYKGIQKSTASTSNVESIR